MRDDAGPVPAAEFYAVDTGIAALRRDPDRRRSWTLYLDGTPQSHVDLDDPAHLAFEYVRRLGHVVDLAAQPGRPLDVVHLGGGALTLARYVAATRPRSRQRAIEIDARLVDMIRRRLPLDRHTRVRVRCGDARTGLGRLPPAYADLVVCDVFTQQRVPSHLTTVEFVQAVARVLRRSGTYAVNLADGPPLTFTRSHTATVRAVLPEVVLLGEPAVLRGRRFGNLVLVASRVPLPVAGLSRRAAGDPAPARLVEGADLLRFTGGARPAYDGSAAPSPLPPRGVFRAEFDGPS